MRIIGGIYRHRLINYPEDRKDIRPTKDRIREAIFSALGPIDNANVLDLYAGSGSMGLEAISRNARYVLFCDIAPISNEVILDNINSLKIDKSLYDVKLCFDVSILEFCSKNHSKFDIIFLDPPYNEGKYEDIIRYILNNEILMSNGVIVCESNRKINIEQKEFSKIKEYNYGDILVTILRK